MDVPLLTPSDLVLALEARVTQLAHRLDTLATLLEQHIALQPSLGARLPRLELAVQKLSDSVAELVTRRPKRARRLSTPGSSPTASRQVSPTRDDGDL